MINLSVKKTKRNGYENESVPMYLALFQPCTSSFLDFPLV